LHGLVFEFEDGTFDGYDEVELKQLKKEYEA